MGAAMTMAAASPHKPTGPTKPEQCPNCGNDYTFRCRPRQDEFRVGNGYRCTYYGYVYVHQGARHPTGVTRQ